MTPAKIPSKSLVHGTNLPQPRLKNRPLMSMARRRSRVTRTPLKLH